MKMISLKLAIGLFIYLFFCLMSELFICWCISKNALILLLSCTYQEYFHSRWLALRKWKVSKWLNWTSKRLSWMGKRPSWTCKWQSWTSKRLSWRSKRLSGMSKQLSWMGKRQSWTSKWLSWTSKRLSGMSKRLSWTSKRGSTNLKNVSPSWQAIHYPH